MLEKRRTTNILLLVIVVPLVFYLLKVLSFIFIPLVFSMFIALLFLPLMRWLGKYKVPKVVSIIIVILLIIGGLKIGVELIHLSSKQIMASESDFFSKAEVKLDAAKLYLKHNFGMTFQENEYVIAQFFKRENIGSTVDFLRNVYKLLNNTLLKKKHASIRAFMKIEKDLNTFIKVKVLVSLLTGIGTGLACVYFDVSFPIFWGLFAFVINFVQMVGSFISVIFLSIFAFVELDPTSTLFFFILSITGVQVLFGAILEPIFMGKSFSINVIAVLVMLMFWGFIWGIPGLIMAIPVTVFIKIILEQFPGTIVIASLLSGNDTKLM
jgi:AI-2 transport protein TqsA